MQVILYSPQTSSRLFYIAEFFSQQINALIFITGDIDFFLQAEAVRINYSASRVADNEVWVSPHSLLFENNISQQDIECFFWNDLQAFFGTGGEIPFDIFAASFYLLTRYEEYLPHQKDMYGRYAHENSIAYKEQFLHLPLIDLWIRKFLEIARQKFPSFHINSLSFKFLPTYDIDIAFAYRHKPGLVQLGGFVKNLVAFKWRELAQRVKVMTGKGKDPFDTYEWLHRLHSKYDLSAAYFFLLAEERRGYDKNISPHTGGVRKLVREHSEKYETGIHPSWQSGGDADVLRSEVLLLQAITGKPVFRSRQHYIRMSFPDTYRLLIDNGIREDHSMGYGSINGFRASVASPFYWYDLQKEEQTSLLIRPFCYMEANSFFEQHYSAEQAAEELQRYYNVVKSVNGELITIFHNHFVTQQKQWLPWRNMYAAFLEKNFGCDC